MKKLNYLVIGLGISGIGAIKLLSQKEEKIFAYDENKKVIQKIQNAKIFSEKVEFLQKIDVKTMKNIDYIVLSPGINTKKYDKFAKKYNIKIISELELAFRFCSFPVLAITGTNGKTTTVNLLFEMIKKVEPTTQLVGNVGFSFCNAIASVKEVNLAVCEVSSFQLEKVESFAPQMVGFLNIENDHLDRYKTFENYFRAKQNIFKNFSKYNIAVLNLDDKNLCELSKTLDCQKYYFSLSKLPKDFLGACLGDEKIVFRLKDKSFEMQTKDIKLLGKHNYQNIMCAGIMALLFGVDFSIVCDTIKNFTLPEHRIEFVNKICGKSFYDDSKGTNIHSTLTAVSCFSKDVILFLGGKDKKENFDNLFKAIPSNVKRIVCFGETGKKIMKSAKKFNFENIVCKKKLKDAFYSVDYKTAKEDVVLLSPACSSFDEFSSFEERGNYFKSLVKGLLNEK